MGLYNKRCSCFKTRLTTTEQPANLIVNANINSGWHTIQKENKLFPICYFKMFTIWFSSISKYKLQYVGERDGGWILGTIKLYFLATINFNEFFNYLRYVFNYISIFNKLMNSLNNDSRHSEYQTGIIAVIVLF